MIAITPSMVFGAANALQGIASSFGAYDKEAEQTKALNKQRLNQYKYQLKQYERTGINRTNLYRQQLSEYGQGIREDQRAYGRALEDSQAQLNELYGQSSLDQQQQQIQLASGLGSARTTGQSGVSQDRQSAMLMGAYGRQQAITMDNLLRARYGNIRGRERLRDQLISSQRQRYGKVALQPTMPIAPPKPVFSPGPSQSALFTNIGGNLLSGVQSGLAFKNDALGGTDTWKQLFG
jgi:hypothetical protein